MRGSTIAGVLLVVFGILVLALGLPYRDSKKVVDLGDFEAQLTEERRIPDWIGITAIGGGVLLLAVGLVNGRAARR